MGMTTKTLANELEMDVFEDFFSQQPDERSYYIIEDSESDLSPRYSPKDRRMSYNDLLDPFSPKNNSVSNASSANRRKLVARVAKGQGAQRMDPETYKHLMLTKSRRKIAATLKNGDKVKQLKLSQKEFAEYLQKKYGNKKGFSRYDNILDKKINLGDLKRRATLASNKFDPQNTSAFAQKSDTLSLKDLDDTLSPHNKNNLQLNAQFST